MSLLNRMITHQNNMAYERLLQDMAYFRDYDPHMYLTILEEMLPDEREHYFNQQGVQRPVTYSNKENKLPEGQHQSGVYRYTPRNRPPLGPISSRARTCRTRPYLSRKRKSRKKRKRKRKRKRKTKS